MAKQSASDSSNTISNYSIISGFVPPPKKNKTSTGIYRCSKFLRQLCTDD